MQFFTRLKLLLHDCLHWCQYKKLSEVYANNTGTRRIDACCCYSCQARTATVFRSAPASLDRLVTSTSGSSAQILHLLRGPTLKHDWGALAHWVRGMGKNRHRGALPPHLLLQEAAASQCTSYLF